jgi:predicted AAA+ superfamily ATPase
MLLAVKDACQLHPMALDYAMGEQIENLSDVIERTAAGAREFFDKNYVTKGMELLLSQGLKRLAGKSDQAVFELKQAMGGGKTHSMIALGLLAREPCLSRHQR